MGVLIGLVVGILIAVPYVIIRRRLFLRNMPDESKKAELLAEVRRMKERGSGYADRLQFLRNAGLRKDVADILLGEAERTASQK